MYPIDKNGVERKWRYARQTVESIIDLLRVKKTNRGYDIEIGKILGRIKLYGLIQNLMQVLMVLS